MRSRASTMSANHRRLAQFIDANYDAVAFSTITQLAELSGVSEATVVRFCKALDYPGYPALQKEIRRLVRADLKGTERFRLGARGGSPLEAVIEKEQENIAALQAGFEPDAFRAGLGLLRDAAEIVVTGSRSTAALANHFWFGLQKMGLRASAM